jgi:hypothetical protein
MTVKRLATPHLTPRALRKGEAGIIQRSFRHGDKDFFRLYRDEPLDLTVVVNREDASAPEVVLHTDIGAFTPGDWREIRFETSDDRTFRLKLDLPRCGLFRFRIKYSLDGGATWYWDRVPHSFVLVDPPAMRTVRLYTLIPGASGTLTDWMRKLGEITAMGFNALHLLPVTRMGASQSPYSGAALFAVDERYRDPADPRDVLDQFEDFVEACRRLGIRLCLDLVLNHVAIDSQLVHECPDWIVPDDAEPDGFKRAGCWHLQSWIRWEDLALLNYDHPNTFVRRDIRDYMKQYALFWANYAAYTGGMVRFDNLHGSNGAFIAELSASLRERFPDMAILGEYFTDEVTLERTVPEWGINLLLANSWEHPFGPQLRHYLQYLHNVSGRLRHLCAITTHDTGVPAQLFGSPRSAMPRYALCALTAMGQTGIVQGVEAGTPERLRFIGPPWRFDPPEDPELVAFFTRINRLLDDYPIFRQGGNLEFVDDGHAAILAACRFPAPGAPARVLIAANLDTYSHQQIEIPLAACRLPALVRFRDALEGHAFTVSGDRLQLTLPPCGVQVLFVEDRNP